MGTIVLIVNELLRLLPISFLTYVGLTQNQELHHANGRVCANRKLYNNSHRRARRGSLGDLQVPPNGGRHYSFWEIFNLAFHQFLENIFLINLFFPILPAVLGAFRQVFPPRNSTRMPIIGFLKNKYFFSGFIITFCLNTYSSHRKLPYTFVNFRELIMNFRNQSSL